jgi:hypothetical protein
MFKKVAILIARGVLMKTKPFAPESTRAFKETAYPLLDSVHEMVICGPPIS